MREKNDCFADYGASLPETLEALPGFLMPTERELAEVNSWFPPYLFYTLGVMLKAVRKNRREAKDLNAVLTPVVEWVEANRATVKALEKLLGEVRKAERTTESRIYTPRTNILDRDKGDLT